MKYKYCDSNSVLAAWAMCSPEAYKTAKFLANSPQWRELTGKEVTIFLRLTKSAAKTLGERLIRASENPDFMILNDVAKPEGTYFDEVWDHDYGFFIHPKGSAISINIVDMEPIETLMSEKNELEETALSDWFHPPRKQNN